MFEYQFETDHRRLDQMIDEKKQNGKANCGSSSHQVKTKAERVRTNGILDSVVKG